MIFSKKCDNDISTIFWKSHDNDKTIYRQTISWDSSRLFNILENLKVLANIFLTHYTLGYLSIWAQHLDHLGFAGEDQLEVGIQQPWTFSFEVRGGLVKSWVASSNLLVAQSNQIRPNLPVAQKSRHKSIGLSLLLQYRHLWLIKVGHSSKTVLYPGFSF